MITTTLQSLIIRWFLTLWVLESLVAAEECHPNEFECYCGTPKCVSLRLLGNGVADCADASDEIPTIREDICPDGLPARHRKSKRRISTDFCGNSTEICSTESGKLCIVADGETKCLCDYGYFRVPGDDRCIPNVFLGNYLNGTKSNCSKLFEDLMSTYPQIFENRLGVRANGVRLALSGDAAVETLGTRCDSAHSCSGIGEKCEMASDGVFRCKCVGVRINGKCVEKVNECSKRSLNDCDRNAICMDNEHGFECLCPEGFIDTSPSPSRRPGLRCQKLVNECKIPQLNDCDRNAVCIDKPIGYTCRCAADFRDESDLGAKRPGRRCTKKATGKCADCDPAAKCSTDGDGYRCECPLGYVDTSVDGNHSGRSCSLLSSDCDSSSCDPNTSICVSANDGVVCQCRRGYVGTGSGCVAAKGSNPCNDYSLHDCDPVAECFSEQPGYFQCRCPKGFVDLSPNKRAPGRRCKKEVNECELGIHECDPNAECLDTQMGYSCRCRSGFLDSSIDQNNAPGRSCRRGNLCIKGDCAPEAECREAADGIVCQCSSGFVDISRQHGKPAGRVCRPLVNECQLNTHDCSPNASCIDTAEGFVCRCRDGFRDDSANAERSGRICVKGDFPPTPDCNVNDPMSCDKTKLEVCIFRSGTYKCSCPNGYDRLPDGRCLVINECLDNRLNNCSPDADCIDQSEGFTCQCRSGYADISPSGQTGRICKRRINECLNPKKFGVDCDANSVCVDTDEGFSCRCRPGFADVSESFNRLPGRRCVEAVNECLDARLNDCSDFAVCEDAKEGYLCACRGGYIDASPNITHYPGRICTKPSKIGNDGLHADTALSLDSCDPNGSQCRPNEVCSDKKVKGEFVCECAENSFRFHDNTCRLLSACESESDCDKNAVCVNVFDSYQCQCRPGFFDASADPEQHPGRVCRELVNECATNTHDCSPFAECVDATNGYACVCIDGFVDTSSQMELLPGRKCSNASNECLHRSLNTCDENADCIDTTDGYVCQCITGYVDVSSSANLPPGRVCTVQTTCPKQKTDLMFLIDGSGSIGSFVFKNEVLRFVREFVELFEIGNSNTRVGLIQYSDQIRHEFDLNQYSEKEALLRAITQTQYLTGLTRTGAAIQHMVLEGFSERRGARTLSNNVSRVAIVITDGRSQDNVTEPSKAARQLKVNMFAIGVTDHVLASELESIAGSPNRWFYVDRFKDLDTRLRSLIQKAACPTPDTALTPVGRCNARAQTGCDRSRNEICVEEKGHSKCQCEKGFERHPSSRVCGGELCNPQVATSCPSPELCQKTLFGNHRCVCPPNSARNQHTGICVSTKEDKEKMPNLSFNEDENCAADISKCRSNEECVLDADNRGHCQCALGYERNPFSEKCVLPGSCDPTAPTPCDVRKNERCLLHPSGRYHTCQCSTADKRHPITDVCLRNECLTGEHDCDVSAKCIDTDDSYICSCPVGFLDQSPEPIKRPGRVCAAEQNECQSSQHNCSPDAICVDTPESFVCRCKPGYVDFSPNPHIAPGLVCKKLINECERAELNTCHQNAICVDTADSYKCLCKGGFVDLDELRNPGRNCEKVHRNERCQSGNNDCDRNARCVQNGSDGFSCICPPGFKDKSPNPTLHPGRVCIPLIPECDNPTLNDCDSPDRAICTDTDDGYLCRCRQGFLDISPNIAAKPGRLCKKLENECSAGTHDCARDGGICEDTPDSYTCRCAINYLDVSFDRKTRPGRKCKRLVDECVTGQNDCSPEASCTDTEDSYICACPANYIDVSTDPTNRPGRRCLRRVNECTEKSHDCSPNADCQDTPEAFKCKCRDDFVDESPDPQRPGRICRPQLIDECRIGKHDCHKDAVCQDLPQGFTCECRAEFLDESPHRITHPGRVCTLRPKPKADECRLDVSTSCRLEMNEVCRVIDGISKCACPLNYERDPITRACIVINECQYPQLNDCHPSAECVDKLNGFECKCRSGFRDMSPQNPGHNCRPLVNECQYPHLNDCHSDAKCTDKEEGYECRCNQGFKDLSPETPGRLCRKMINECASDELNSCDSNAKCSDTDDGYKCECRKGYLDVSPSPTLLGRSCRPIVNECSDIKLNDCDKSAKCIDTEDSFKCECPANSKDISPNPSFPGRVCLIFENECLTRKHDCDPNALCHDNEQAFSCECPAGYTDRSPNKATRPGRVCVKLVDECSTGRHTCSANAECRDLDEGYTCECKDGYVDRSPNLRTQPGRVCGTPEVCPSNHECSSAAICEPLGGTQYKCTCIQGYVDQSPKGTEGRICVRNNACHDNRLNNCSRNAICYDESSGYRCECKRGFVDRSPGDSARGRICEPPPPPPPPQRHPCQDAELNDCHSAGTCRATGAQTYTCECLAGYVDKSPEPKSKPGRICVLTEPVCLDPKLNDCHPAAICSESNDSNGYTCRCRDGYVDQSPKRNEKPGRICVELVNECLDRSLNDCDPLAVCEDLPNGYSCRCPVNAVDQSVDKKRPGRKCFAQINECMNPSLHNCSRFADCIDKQDGYECHCRKGYHDNNPKQPGTVCSYIINECESSNLNDCHRNAECMDLPGGYDCRCRKPYNDMSPDGLRGRVCLLDECSSAELNKCDKNADCQDTAEGYLCNCREGYYDVSPDPLEQGRVCQQYSENEPNIHIQPLHTQNSDEIRCGLSNTCSVALGEVCIGSSRCGCKPGFSRRNQRDRCQQVEKIPLVFRVVARGPNQLIYSSEYADPRNAVYVDLTRIFAMDMGKSIGGTDYKSRYVNTAVSYITHPKTVNSTWDNGILIHFDVEMLPTKVAVDKCDLWRQLMESLQRTNGAVGSGMLRVPDDLDLLDPCAKALIGESCGFEICNAELGEVCIANELCGCKDGQKRARSRDVCRPVESWQIPLWVIRKHQQNLIYNESFKDPMDSVNKMYVKMFLDGIAASYQQTPLKSAFVSVEVNEIVEPMRMNASWDTGILYNATVNFRRGAVVTPSDVYYSLIKYITRNGHQIDSSGLFINPYQPDPFKPCFKNNCHPNGICTNVDSNSYKCECSAGYRDLNPTEPGHRCLLNHGYNECENREDNECSEHARCIDLEYLYKCECNAGYTDSAPKGGVPGSVCVLDYCSDVSFCPLNSTCVNMEQQAECECNHGFMDIRHSESRTSLGMHPDTFCLNIQDVDECALGLTNCSGVAVCTDSRIGYSCRCPDGYIDGNPAEPGRVCGALLCDLCNQHGDCVHSDQTKNITCSCTDGYTGEFCEVLPSNAGLILLIILALAFLILTLCCLLFACTKCRCFKQYRGPLAGHRGGIFPWNTLDHSNSSDSGADFSAMSAAGDLYPHDLGIPRPKLKTRAAAAGMESHSEASASRLASFINEGMRIPRPQLHDTSSLGSGSSEYTIREEIERRVITDITTTETKATTSEEAVDEFDSTIIHAEAEGNRGETEIVKTQAFTSSGGASSSAAKSRQIFEGTMDEQERGESVAEFSNGNAKEVHSVYKAGDYKRGKFT